VVPSQRISVNVTADPFDIYRILRTVNPSPYMYYMSINDVQVAGASPEMLVRVENGVVETRPIAGSRPRGATQAEDARLAAELVKDPKEIAEHVMLVDLGRNDIGRVSAYGSVKVEEMMHVEQYSHVMHLVSNVSGLLRPEFDALDALFACFPAGTLSGAPKIRAMEIIDEIEPVRRGLYGGALGYIDFSGSLDTCIVIRTVVCKAGTAYIQAGAGIVADSVPATEYDETMNKARALLTAINDAKKIIGRD
jgi:anthranilate synthase component I